MIFLCLGISLPGDATAYHRPDLLANGQAANVAYIVDIGFEYSVLLSKKSHIFSIGPLLCASHQHLAKAAMKIAYLEDRWKVGVEEVKNLFAQRDRKGGNRQASFA